MMTPNVSLAGFIQLLRGALAEEIERVPGASLRSFSKKLGLSPGAFSQLLNGKRPLTVKMVRRLCHALDLPGGETARWLDVARLLEGTSRRSARRPRSLDYVRLEDDQFKAISEWHCFAILSLVKTRGFRSDPQWIASRLGVSVLVVKLAIDRLLRLGMLVRGEDRSLRRGSARYQTSEDVVNLAIRKSHTGMLANARRSLSRDQVEARDFSSMTMAIDPARLPEAKEAIRRFQDELSVLLEESGETSEVYTLGMQLFPLTRVKAKVATLLVAAAMLLGGSPSLVWAGDRVGNGGSSWVCRTQGAITWASITDIFEARNELGLGIPDRPTVPVEQLESEAEIRVFRANRNFYEVLVSHLERVKKILRILDGSLGLAPVQDVVPRVYPKPETCPGGSVQLEQLANYTNGGDLVVNREIWNALPPVDRAALYLHEAIYSLLREREQAQDSQRSRRLVGFAFSDREPESYAAEFALPDAPSEPGWTEAYSKTSMLQLAFKGKELRFTLDNRGNKWAYQCGEAFEIKYVGSRNAILFFEGAFGKKTLSVMPDRVFTITAIGKKPIESAGFYGKCTGLE